MLRYAREVLVDAYKEVGHYSLPPSAGLCYDRTKVLTNCLD